MGIWGIAIAGACFVGVLSANPVVEAAGGWKAAFDDLLAQITSNDAEIADHETRVTDLETQSAKIFKFGSTANVGIPRGLGPTQMVGFDGTITKFVYSFTMDSVVPPLPVTVILRVNNIDTSLSCQITAITGTLVTCSPTGSIPVTEFDLVNVREFQGVFNTITGSGFANVFITPNP